MSNVCLTLSNVCESKFWVTLVDEQKSIWKGNIMTVRLYLVEVFLFEIKKNIIVISWSNENVCVFLTLTKSMFETKLG